MLDLERLDGKAFLDAGCGSGLFSLAAQRLDAERVRSFDFDPDSVTCAEALRSSYGDDRNWEISTGDVTSAEFCRGLGSFDFVYSWGVIHHTGAMWQAAENLCALVAPHGLLCVAVYNDQGARSRLWRRVKRLYNRSPRPLRPIVAALAVLPRELKTAAAFGLSGRIREYVRSWRSPGPRGMNRWHDIVDWVGGYPFDVATPAEVVDFHLRRGFELKRLRTVGGSAGCNEYVFRRKPE